MLTEQFQTIYSALLRISSHAALFESEKALVQTAQDALATAEIKAMWSALLSIALRQGFYTDEQKIVAVAQAAIKQILLQARMID